MGDIYSEVVHLARLALAGRPQDIQMFLRRLAKGIRADHPDAAKEIEKLLSQSPTRSSPLREVETAVPVDADSRLQLVRTEYPVDLVAEPIWSLKVGEQLRQVVSERERESELLAADLHPTKSMLLVGPPGVGKSLGAKWLASKIGRPLVTLDLSAVMSSFLGRTGVNVRYVLEYAKSMNCVLLLDELDAVAKRRDDEGEIGELKRLVTVLLQEIDGWPASGLLVAATNHPELLDPAVWRRFERVIEFPMPETSHVRQLVSRAFSPHGVRVEWIEILAATLEGMSHSDIDRELRGIQRDAIVSGDSIEAKLERTVGAKIDTLPIQVRKRAADGMLSLGLSERHVSKVAGVHRSVAAKLQKQRKSRSQNGKS